jgi:hypothetical protein
MWYHTYHHQVVRDMFLDFSSPNCQRYITGLFFHNSSPFFLDSIPVCVHGDRLVK